MRMAPAAPTVDGSPSGSTPSPAASWSAKCAAPAPSCLSTPPGFRRATDGRVARILLRPGAQVEPNDVILELHSPGLAQEVEDTRLQLLAAEARLRTADADATTALLAQEALVAATEAKYEEARSDAEADSALLGDGLVSELQHRRRRRGQVLRCRWPPSASAWTSATACAPRRLPNSRPRSRACTPCSP